MATEISIDQVCGWLIEGRTYREISIELNVPLSTLHDFLSKDEHSARAREALLISADEFAEKAERVLNEAEWDTDAGDFDLKKARELAHHYRWKAAKRNPKRYSDKVDVTSDGDKIQQLNLQHVPIELLEKIAAGNTGSGDTGDSAT